MTALETLTIESVMIHRIPKVRRADKDDVPLELMESPISLTPLLRRFFRERLLRSLGQSFGAVHDPPEPADERGHLSGAASPVPRLIVSYFDGDMADLVELSRTLAEELYARQTGSASEGLLVVMDARVGSGKDLGAVLAILKLEDDEALMVQPTTTPDGRKTFDASIRAITLPGQAKVFKAAVFPRAAALADLSATVSDPQRDRNVHGQEVAEFFLRFLGCRLRTSADRSTKEYLERTEQWIRSLSDESLRSKYHRALIADVASESTTIDPNEFAKKHLAAEHRDSFLRDLKTEDGSVPVITKDVTLLRNRLDQVVYEFADGVRVSGPRSAVERVLVRDDDGLWALQTELLRASVGRR